MKKAVKQIKAAKQKAAEKQRKIEVLPSKKELSNIEGAIPSMESGQTESSGEIVLPEGFLTRMKNILEENEYEAFLSSYGQERLFSLRVNTLKTGREFFMKLVSKERASDAPSLVPVPWEQDGFYYSEKWRPGRLPWHEAGMYYIQEASAMAPAVLCGAQPGERILDLCAAPGGKSTKLAASLRGRGLLVANEIHPDRARVLSANIERMGVRNAVVTNETPQRLASRFPVFFDRIVVDAPCSGEGMFRKEEEALLNWSMENVYRCAARQEEILEEAASMLRPGGTLIYSTCTFAPEENEAVIFHFLADHPEFDVEIISDLPGVDKKGILKAIFKRFFYTFFRRKICRLSRKGRGKNSRGRCGKKGRGKNSRGRCGNRGRRKNSRGRCGKACEDRKKKTWKKREKFRIFRARQRKPVRRYAGKAQRGAETMERILPG